MVKKQETKKNVLYITIFGGANGILTKKYK